MMLHKEGRDDIISDCIIVPDDKLNKEVRKETKKLENK